MSMLAESSSTASRARRRSASWTTAIANGSSSLPLTTLPTTYAALLR
jgi:hypothetical protein